MLVSRRINLNLGNSIFPRFLSSKIAILIDGDQITTRAIPLVKDKLQTMGSIVLMKAFGSKSHGFGSNSWKKRKQEISNLILIDTDTITDSNGKRMTDSFIVAETSKLVLQSEVDKIAIVSNDNDFRHVLKYAFPEDSSKFIFVKQKEPWSFARDSHGGTIYVTINQNNEVGQAQWGGQSNGELLQHEYDLVKNILNLKGYVKPYRPPPFDFSSMYHFVKDNRLVNDIDLFMPSSLLCKLIFSKIEHLETDSLVCRDPNTTCLLRVKPSRTFIKKNGRLKAREDIKIFDVNQTFIQDVLIWLSWIKPDEDPTRELVQSLITVLRSQALQMSQLPLPPQSNATLWELISFLHEHLPLCSNVPSFLSKSN